ncbi:rod shape-determining protein RodA [Candidatus Berkelbacteria bacterium CG10_big_fil_rev_8_21_14_0_10_43_13]|uniref:Rod shape-determining protein RodA n=1 Tax=Candidatus Berkelbacteria bacterium CG10_big_fil_rev_8_21_14_0_10_43_13 TaxID=1974514 RepID=A0A2H0W6V7_9BACT|nr:MAG: rod shape-determining protein RodA [Candidatus Berkelbacteria bacterium CG10_big_fil_rev_8_21_14_0_10_43_13]
MSTKIKTFDFSLMIIPIIFTVIGVSVIYSLVLGTASDGLATKQGVIALFGIVAMLVASFSDYRFFRGVAPITYVISVVLLILVNFFGKTTNGAENWLDLKYFQLQPSELAKVFLVISMSAFFSKLISRIRWSHIFISLCLLAPPLILILKEPDLGTAVVIMVTYLTILLLAKPSASKVAIIFLVIAAACGVITLSYKNVGSFGRLLATYQKERIAVFLDPSLDPYGRGYNIKQAQITVGSGGITGKGLGKGSQSQLQFLPEAHTDFIFAGIAESYGFLGSFVLLVLYCFFIIRFIDIAALSKDNFGMLLVFGLSSMFLIQLVISVGMNLGILPVTGIPLPFLSYGGTSLFVSYFAVGLAQSVYIRHHKINF